VVVVLHEAVRQMQQKNSKCGTHSFCCHNVVHMSLILSQTMYTLIRFSEKIIVIYSTKCIACENILHDGSM
jgi:hypothetical protein